MKILIHKILDRMGYTLTKKSAWNGITDLIPEATESEMDMIRRSMQYSMGNNSRMWALLQSIKHIHHTSIEGDIVECGVWAGGNIILSALAGHELNLDKTIWAYDTYTGMSEPTDADVNAVDNKSAKGKWEQQQQDDQNNWCLATLEEVTANLKKELPAINNIKLIKGMVEDTLSIPENVPEKIALLRLDTDFYESTKKELEVLYPRLQSGGILIIDDYGHWQGARQAVDEYFSGQNIWLHRIDYTARLVIKAPPN